MNGLSEQRCFNHDTREAVARCPECRNFFCRECITEHEGRVVCASCLPGVAGPSGKDRAGYRLLRPLLVFMSLALLWGSFFALGRTLLMLPDSFHNGSVWTGNGSSLSDEDEQ